jgi:putative peptidoglycan lipid II flippase
MSFGRSLFTVSGLTVLSRVAGFVRDTLTAMYLGAGPVADAFFVAQRLPNLFRSLFAEGAFSAAFVPLYTAEHEKHGQDAAQQFAGQALMLLLGVLIPFSALIMMFMPQVMLILAPGFDREPEKYRLAVDFSTITFPYLALVSVTALQSGVLNAQNRFGPGAAAPIALNLVLIAALFIAHFAHFHVGYALAWAVTISGVVQMLWLMISCRRAKLSIPIVWPHLGHASKQLFKRIGPGAVGAGAVQINLLVSTILASTLPTGAVSYLFYADRVNQLPLGIVGVAVATTLLPILARHVASGKEDNVRHYTSRAIEFCLVLGLPATVGLVIAAQPIIQTLFERGAFSHADTMATSQTLAAYSLGIPAFLLVKVFASSFFARHDTSTPVRIAVVAMVVNVCGCLLLIGPLQFVGIALANSVAVWTNALLLFVQMKRCGAPIGDSKLLKRLPRLLLASGVMAAVTWALVELTQDFYAGRNLGREAIALTVIIGLSSLVYGALLHVTGAMRLKDVLDVVKRKPLSMPDTGKLD